MIYQIKGFNVYTYIVGITTSRVIISSMEPFIKVCDWVVMPLASTTKKHWRKTQLVGGNYIPDIEVYL